jgi:hypothetical protein
LFVLLVYYRDLVRRLELFYGNLTVDREWWVFIAAADKARCLDVMQRTGLHDYCGVSINLLWNTEHPWINSC